MKLSEVMNSPAATVEAHTQVWLAADAMGRTGCSFLPVVERGKVVGVLTGRDLVTRVMAKGLNPDAVRVSAAMSSPPITLGGDQDVEEAVILLRQRNVRRLVVVDRDGSAIGVLSLSDLAGNATDESITKTLQRHAENSLPQTHPFVFTVPGLSLG